MPMKVRQLINCVIVVITRDQHDFLRWAERTQPVGSLNDLGFKSDLDQVACHQHTVRRSRIHRVSQPVQDIAPVYLAPIPFQRKKAGTPFAPKALEGLEIQGAQVWIGEVNEAHG
jgi:hypothetical protein